MKIKISLVLLFALFLGNSAFAQTNHQVAQSVWRLEGVYTAGHFSLELIPYVRNNVLMFDGTITYRGQRQTFRTNPTLNGTLWTLTTGNISIRQLQNGDLAWRYTSRATRSSLPQELTLRRIGDTQRQLAQRQQEQQQQQIQQQQRQIQQQQQQIQQQQRQIQQQQRQSQRQAQQQAQQQQQQQATSSVPPRHQWNNILYITRVGASADLRPYVFLNINKRQEFRNRGLRVYYRIVYTGHTINFVDRTQFERVMFTNMSRHILHHNHRTRPTTTLGSFRIEVTNVSIR